MRSDSGPSSPAAKPPVASLYERLGGESALMAAVPLFYQKVLADPLVSPFFLKLDMEGQIQKQISFMSRAFGGPAEYAGRDLRSSHAHMVERGLSDSHFDAIARHLKTTLEELGIEAGMIGETLALVESTRSQVLGR